MTCVQENLHELKVLKFFYTSIFKALTVYQYAVYQYAVYLAVCHFLHPKNNIAITQRHSQKEKKKIIFTDIEPSTSYKDSLLFNEKNGRGGRHSTFCRGARILSVCPYIELM